MALRLTKTTLPASPGVSEADSARATYEAENQIVQGFVNRAARLLGENDLPGYLQLFAEATELENPHRVYQLRKLLLEQGLASLSGVNEKRATEILLAMARGAIGALEADPAEPVLLNYA